MTPGVCTRRPRCAAASSRARAPASRWRRSARDAPRRWSRTSCTRTWPHAVSSIAARSARVAGVWRTDGEALAEVRLPADVDTAAYEVHPALLDACLQPIAAVLPDRSASYLPVSVERVERHARPTARCWSHVRLRPGAMASGAAVVADVRVVDDVRLAAADRAGRAARAGQPRRVAPPGRRPARAASSTRSRGSRAPIPAGEPAADALPDPLALAAAVTPEIARARARHNLAAYDELAPSLDALAADYIAAALARLGWSGVVGERVDVDVLAARLAILPRYRRLLGRFLEILGETGVLVRASDGWTVARPLSPTRPGPTVETLRARHPEASAELTLTERCGGALAEALTGGCRSARAPVPRRLHGDRRGVLHGLAAGAGLRGCGRRDRRRRVRGTRRVTAVCACSRSAAAPAARPRRCCPYCPPTGRTTCSRTSRRCSRRAPRSASAIGRS